jgi:hypothetical protein
VNSSGATFTPGRNLIILGLLMDFLQVHHLCIPIKPSGFAALDFHGKAFQTGRFGLFRNSLFYPNRP